MTLLIGSEGRIGKRYQAIFRHLGEAFIPVDKETSMGNMLSLAVQVDRILLCTPTNTHYTLLKDLFAFRKPILCEKPITKDFEELTELIDHVNKHGLDFKMVMQYKEIAQSQLPLPSIYNYFNHGPDGLYWDAMQTIGLARGPITLGEDSPIWRCQINGEPVEFRAMDHAYVKMIDRWLAGVYEQTTLEIMNVHRKVLDLIDEQQYI